MAATAQARLDEEITRLTIKLSSLKTQKNTFALISRLPMPILARIFVYYARDDYYRPLYYLSRSMRSRWIGVSFVCRHWRRVALACPAPWSYLFVASPWWTEALLSRSVDSPLRMWLEFWKSDKALDFMARVAMHTERIQECCLVFARSNVARAFSVVSSRAAPLLRILKITIQEPETLGKSMDSSKQEQAQNDHILFNGDTPMLRELGLTNYDMPWYSPSLGGLTTLQLCNLATSVQLTMTELRAVLDRSPHLVELDLENALRSGLSSSTYQDSEKLHLSSLTRLLITAPFPEILTFLSYVKVPSTTQVRLACHQRTHPRADDFIPFCSFLSQWFRAPTNKATPFTPIRSIFIEGAESRMRFVFGTLENVAPSTNSKNFEHEAAPLKVDFDPWPPLSRRGDDMIGMICQSVPLAHLERITLEDCSLSPTVWEDTFWDLQGLRTIELIGAGLSDLIETLLFSSRSPSPNSEGLPQVFAPSLEEIVLQNIAFVDYRDGYDDIYVMPRLIRALARREKEAGRALKRLGLYYCLQLDNDDVQGLSDVVGSVDWDLGEQDRRSSTDNSEDE